MSARFWQWLQQKGVRLADPRPAFPPVVEEELQGTLESALAKGRSPPEPAAALSRHIQLLQRDRGRSLLYVLESISTTGFWGVGVAEIAELRQQPLPWSLVLLESPKQQGYWLPDCEVVVRVPHWRRTVPAGPTYELTPEDLTGAPTFGSYPELLGWLDQQLAQSR